MSSEYGIACTLDRLPHVAARWPITPPGVELALPTSGVMQAVDVKISNPLSGFTRTTTTDAAGKYVFRNLPPNPYHISVVAQGFMPLERDVSVRSAVPIDVDLTLALAGGQTSVEVVGHAEDLLERDPTAHTDIDQSLVEKLPIETVGGLNQVITMASPGVVADSNGFFHPVGDHAQTQFSIDNQPVTDQQSRVYSNQIWPNTATRAASSYTSSPNPGSTNPSRRATCRSATGPSRRRRSRRTSAVARIRSETFSR